jgi:hypothetical protein
MSSETVTSSRFENHARRRVTWRALGMNSGRVESVSIPGQLTGLEALASRLGASFYRAERNRLSVPRFCSLPSSCSRLPAMATRSSSVRLLHAL